MTALILTGVAPSFADEKPAGGSEKGFAPSADIDWSDAPAIEGTSGIIMDAKSGEILYEKNIHDRRDPASVTKILTCLVVLETMDLDKEITVNQDVGTIGHVMKLQKGEVITVEELLYGLMVHSANDAAEVLAVAAGGSVENFCDMMNERARRCGANETTFTNPNGLNTYGQENHKTSAYDLALITKEAMKNKTFRKLVSTVKHTIPATNKSEARKLKSTNRCLYDKHTLEINGEKVPYKYEGTIGAKTGSTGTAGECFCGVADRNGTTLIAITLNSSTPESRFADVIQLWDYGFSKYRTYTVAGSGKALEQIRVKRGAKADISAGIADDMVVTLNKKDDSEITTEINLDEEKPMAPINRGDVLGEIVAYKDGKAVCGAELIAMESVEKGGLLSYIGIADEYVPHFIVTVVLVLLILIILRILYVQNRRRKRRRRRNQRNRNMRRREMEHRRNPFDN